MATMDGPVASICQHNAGHRHIQPGLDNPTVSQQNMATALFKAVGSANFSKVRFLLGHSVAATVRTDRGLNLLMVALRVEDSLRRHRMFRLLVRRGADVCCVDPETGMDVLSWACVLGRPREAGDVLEAAQGDIDVTRADRDGLTALHHATIAGDVDSVRLLLQYMDKYRLSVDVPDKSGLTPYIYAQRLGFFSIAKTLELEGQCSRNQFDSGQFRSVDDWVSIGYKERQEERRRDQQRLRASYKIRGKQFYPMSIKHTRFQLPTIIVSGNSESVELSNSSVAKNTKDTKFPRIRTDNPYQTQKSVEHAFALMGLQADDGSQHVSAFVSSERDTTKAQADLSSALGSLMDILSAQQTSAFRAVARPSTPPPPRAPTPPRKKKVSTLAILFGRNNSTKKYKPQQKAPKKGKSLTDHAKRRKKNKNCKT